MVNVVPKLVARHSDHSGVGALSPTALDLLITLLALLFVAILLTGGLLWLRRKRQSKTRHELPFHNGQVSSNHRRLTISTSAPPNTESLLVYEKRSLMENSSSPPDSPVPEIRITFPEEEDEAGRRKSGRVVVVRISDGGGVGLEPFQEELPPYQANEPGRFHSLDIERLGGLKEKEESNRYS